MANGIRTGDPVDSIKDVVWSSVKVPKFDKHLKKARGHIGWNVVEITIKMKTIVQKPLMIKIIKLCLRNLNNLMILIYNQLSDNHVSLCEELQVTAVAYAGILVVF